MSKLMGKMILNLEKKSAEAAFSPSLVSSFGLRVRYLHVRGVYEFYGLRHSMQDVIRDLRDQGLTLSDIGEKRAEHRVFVSGDVLSLMIQADKVGTVVNEFSIGYKVPVKVKSERELMRRELGWISSVLGLELEHSENSDVAAILTDFDAYCDLCVWQEVFNISDTILKRVKSKRGGGWVKLSVRRNNKGRRVGALGKAVSERSEYDPQRVERNKRLAVERGVFAWYEDACKEECAGTHVAFSHEKCLKEFNECRKMSLKERDGID